MVWEDKYDTSIKALVRETLTIMEGVIVADTQRAALRRMLRKTIYSITADLKEDILKEVGPIKPEKVAEIQGFEFPKGE